MYDFSILKDKCRDNDFRYRISEDNKNFIVCLLENIELIFHNGDSEHDCYVFFPSLEWHEHDRFTFYGPVDTEIIELTYVEVIDAFANSKVYVCDKLQKGELMERSLVHRDALDMMLFDELDSDTKLIFYGISKKCLMVRPEYCG